MSIDDLLTNHCHINTLLHMYNFIDDELCYCNFYNTSYGIQAIKICWITNGCGIQMVIVI
jgi:hypothetical protein